MGVWGQRHGPAALTPGNNRYPSYRRVGVDPWADVDECGRSHPYQASNSGWSSP